MQVDNLHHYAMNPEHVLSAIVAHCGGVLNVKADELRAKYPELSVGYDESTDSYTYRISGGAEVDPE